MKNIIHRKGSKIWWYKDLLQVYISNHWDFCYAYEDLYDPGVFNHMLQIGKLAIAW